MTNLLKSNSGGLWLWTFGSLPNWLMLPGLRRSWSISRHIDEMPIQTSCFDKGQPTDVKLGAELFLIKTLTFPKAAQKSLAQAVDLHVQQTSPKSGENLVWRHKIKVRRGSEIVVQVFLLKNQVLDELKKSANKSGTILRTVSIADCPIALPLLDDRAKIDKPRRVWCTLMFMMLFGMLSFIAWAEYRETVTLKAGLANLQAKQLELRADAVSLRATRDAENNELSSISHDISTFTAEHSRLQPLLELTDTLSDKTWVSDVAINGHKMRISGFTSADVPEVMSRIRQLHWAMTVDLEGAVTFDSFSRQHRFDFLVELNTKIGNPL